MFKRHIAQTILDALADTPVVFLRGARQCGKTTLVRELARTKFEAAYVTLDNAATLAASGSDPAGFIAGLPKPVIIDEVQRVPGLLLAIKEDVDANRMPGRYLLTGSANVMAMPRVADSLIGRMAVITLWPLSQAEIEGVDVNWIDAVFDTEPAHLMFQPTELKTVMNRMVSGGFPEPLQRASARRKASWFNSYLTGMIERDVRDLSQVRDITVLPKLLKLLAARSTTLFNQSEISRSAGIVNSTLGRYLSVLEATFLIHMLPAWSTNIGKRLTKSPKLVFIDTGLACHLLGVDHAYFSTNFEIAGRMFENFVVSEILKQASWSSREVNIFHFRSASGREVDVVLEDRAGNMVGVEVKLTASPNAGMFSGLQSLQELAGRRFRAGIMLYTGKDRVPFGKKLQAVPVSTLWHGRPAASN
jgi:predicted AAA+ superfamily ATPase